MEYSIMLLLSLAYQNVSFMIDMITLIIICKNSNLVPILLHLGGMMFLELLQLIQQMVFFRKALDIVLLLFKNKINRFQLYFVLE